VDKLVPRSKINIISNEAIINNSIIKDVQNIIVANNKSGIQAAKEQALNEGFLTEIIYTDLHGEASLAGRKLAETLKNEMTQRERPFCLISGGETTVTLHGNGKGGRNQELALAAVEILDNLEKVMLVSLATDGNDGPTEAAGAVVDGNTNNRAKKIGMSATEYLSRNDAFSYFETLGDLLKPGYSGTNVNDLIFLFGL
jgi:hydroxypyruvate reductase